MKKNQKNYKKLIIALILITIITVGINYPKVLFFLSSNQQDIITNFKESYFSSSILPKGNILKLGNIVAAIIIILQAVIFNSVVKILGSYIKFKDHHAQTLKSLAFNLINYAIVIWAIISVLSIFGVNMSAVIAGLGLLSLIIGFGAETLIEDVITGLFIVFEGQLQVGDIIAVDGFRGTVTSIGIRTTQITDIGGNTRIVNNSDIRTITNLSERSSAAVTIISIAYEASLEEAEKVVKDTLEKLPTMYENVFKEVPQYTGVEALGASSVDLRIIAYVDEPNVYNAKRAMNRELKLALDKANIDIPFPQVVVHQAKR